MTEIKNVKIKTYYVSHHYDGLSRLSPLILLDGEKVWNVGQKKKISGTKMYYLFLDYSKYIKLWRDSKNNLLFTIDNFDSLMFFDEEPDVFSLDVFLRVVQWDEEALYSNDKKIEFTIPIFNIVQRVSTWATHPLAFLLYQMFAYESSAPIYTSPSASTDTSADSSAEPTNSQEPARKYLAIDENRNIVAEGNSWEEVEEIMEKKGYKRSQYDILTVVKQEKR